MAQHRSSRRQLISGTASLMLLAPAAVGAAKAEDLDGALIAAAAEYAQLEDEYSIVSRIEDESPAGHQKAAAEAKMVVIEGRQAELFDAMCDMPTRTPEGLRAKALAALCKMGDGDSRARQPISSDDNLAWSLIEDILGRTDA